MKVPINSPADLGEVIRATRKSNNLRMDDLAGIAGVGHVFVGDVEYGKETAQIGRVMRLLGELGIKLSAEVPASAEAYLGKIRDQNGLVRPSQRKPQKGSQ